MKRKIDYKKILICFAAMILGSVMFVIPAFADAPNASDTMLKLINLILSMFKYVGAAIFVWAIIQFILATKRSDADSKADAVQTAVCGIVSRPAFLFFYKFGKNLISKKILDIIKMKEK